MTDRQIDESNEAEQTGEGNGKPRQVPSISRDTLTDYEKLAEAFRRYVAAGLLEDSQDGRITWLAVVAHVHHAVKRGKARNPVGLFCSFFVNRKFHDLSAEDEKDASRALESFEEWLCPDTPDGGRSSNSGEAMAVLGNHGRKSPTQQAVKRIEARRKRGRVAHGWKK